MITIKKIEIKDCEIILFLKFKYDEKLLDFVRGYSKRQWINTEKIWKVILITKFDIERTLNTDFINEEEKNKIKEILEKINKKANISKLINKEDLKNFITDTYKLETIPLPSDKKLYNYQEAGVYLIDYYLNYKNNKGVILGDDMGLGKTIISIAYMNLKNIKKFLVICPSSVISVWYDKINEWYLGEKNFSINEFNGGNIHICSYNKFQKIYDNGELENYKLDFDLFIIDEFHYIKNYKAKRTKAITGLTKKLNCKVIGLSGTPFENRPIELFNMLNIAQPNVWEFWNFVRTYCDAYKSKYGWVMTGASNMEELNLKLRYNVMIRREKKEVLDFLPDKTRDILRFEIEKDKSLEKQEKILFDLLEKIKQKKNELNNIEIKEQRELLKKEIKEYNDIIFEEMATYRKNIGLAKSDIILDFIEDILDQKEKVVVFAHHHEVIDKISDYLDKNNIKYVKLTGETNINNRGDIIKQFQEEKDVRVFIGSIRTASEGITLTAADVVVIAEFDLNPQKMLQAEDRVYRIGQKNNVNIYWLSAKDSFDDYLLGLVINKIDVFEKAIVGQINEKFDLIEL